MAKAAAKSLGYPWTEAQPEMLWWLSTAFLPVPASIRITFLSESECFPPFCFTSLPLCLSLPFFWYLVNLPGISGFGSVNLRVMSRPRTARRRPEPVVTTVDDCCKPTRRPHAQSAEHKGRNPAACICLESDVLPCTEPMGEFLGSPGLNSLKYLFSFNFGFRFLRFWVSSFFFQGTLTRRLKKISGVLGFGARQTWV